MKIRRELAEEILQRYADDYPEVKFYFKEEPPPYLVAAFVFWVFRVISRFFPEAYHWFMEQTVTMLGDGIFFPESKRNQLDVENMSLSTYVTLCHEYVHLEQRKKNFLWSLRYLICFPTLYTERSKWEMEAYLESVRAMYRVTGIIPARVINRYTDIFVGPHYLWMVAPWDRPKVYSKFVNEINKLREK